MAASKKLVFQILDHGCDGSSYFPGCGTFDTRYSGAATGIGDSAAEAASDALEQIYTNEDMEQVAPCDLEALEAACKLSEVQDAFLSEPNDEWHHFVSIRYHVSEP